jgi:hypothetical protein
VKFAVPLYVAVIMFVPAGNEVTDTAAVADEVNVNVPSVFAPDWKVTDPVGVPPLAAVTVAVNFTAAPNAEGFNDEVSATAVLA